MTVFPAGPVVIPAHPLAVDADGRPDWPNQRLLTRYYLAAGATGLAVGVHTTQFEVHDEPGLLEEVYGTAAELASVHGTPETVLVAGVCGDTEIAVREAEMAAAAGYRTVLLSNRGVTQLDEAAQLERARAIGEVLPVLGFYMQDSVGGHYLSPDFWGAFFEIPSVIGVKIAPFDRYRTRDVLAAVAAQDRWRDLVVLTGNDDTIVTDLVSPHQFEVGGEQRAIRFRGGLLGQWAVGTHAAVELVNDVWQVRDQATPCELLTRAGAVTEVNQAIFDPENKFAGAVAGVNELLRQQGLLASSRCLSDRERLSPGQADKIRLARERHPHLTDEDFVRAHLAQWRDEVATSRLSA